jgi:hypothetical protein
MKKSTKTIELKFERTIPASPRGSDRDVAGATGRLSLKCQQPKTNSNACSCANSSSLTFVLRVLVRSGGFTTRHHHGKQPIAKGGSPLGSPLFSETNLPYGEPKESIS